MKPIALMVSVAALCGCGSSSPGPSCVPSLTADCVALCPGDAQIRQYQIQVCPERAEEAFQHEGLVACGGPEPIGFSCRATAY